MKLNPVGVDSNTGASSSGDPTMHAPPGSGPATVSVHPFDDADNFQFSEGD